MSPPLLQADRLNHVYADGTRALSNISFKINRGEFILVAGRNGAGKSTLFRHLNGLQTPTSGDVRLDGRPVDRLGRRALERVGLVFQNADTQIVGETVWDDLVFGPINLGLSSRETHERASRAMGEMGLDHLKDRDPVTLSGGEKKRLAIAGILAMSPDILILDEPFAGLDDPSTASLILAITALHRSGRTLILATHDVEKIIYYATRLMILSGGRMAADGPVEDTAAKLVRNGVRPPCSLRLGLGITPWISPEDCRRLRQNPTPSRECRG